VKRLKDNELKDFLDEKVEQYNRPAFIADDPISIPRLFTIKEDIEIAGFLAATLAWGQRTVIIKNTRTILRLMDDSPHDFILNFSKKDLLPFRPFVHRTFNGEDCIGFLNALQHIYKNYASLENVFIKNFNSGNHRDYKESISSWRSLFFSTKNIQQRSKKHFANPQTGSAAKRLNMFLRWMIRKDNAGVDLGIWSLDPAFLTCPLDVHSSRVARKLGLMKRKQNDWTAATELTTALKVFDPNDPVKYDFALFGLGVYEKF
jgi:uncharacterized protein (TIGR02757 family)